MPRYAMDYWRDDMGSLKGTVSSLEDALWDIISARRHDGLDPLTLEEITQDAIYPTSCHRLKLTELHKP